MKTTTSPHDKNARKKSGYVYRDYKPGASVYHFTNLIIDTNLQVRTMPSKNSSKVRYFLSDTEHERLMETIVIRDDRRAWLYDNRWDLS